MSALLHSAFVTCPKDIEPLLLEELQAMGLESTRATLAGVSVQGELGSLYRICLWSRLANRVLLELARFNAGTPLELYDGARIVDWQEHFDTDATFVIHCTGSSGELTDTRFAALRVKDAIADQFRERTGSRPSVDTRHPDIRLHVRLHRGSATISLDLSGESLHRRGYRADSGAAPIKENLASALLLRAGWPQLAEDGGALVDPLCGAGTLLIEGAQMALGIAPGLAREHWGFNAWLGHMPGIWRDLLTEADARAAATSDMALPLVGYDADPRAVLNAERNIERAGLAGRITVANKDLEQLRCPRSRALGAGLLIMNPPYGIRLGGDKNLAALYATIGRKLREEFGGWRAGLITATPALGKKIGLRASKRFHFMNGALPSQLLLFEVKCEQHMETKAAPASPQPAPALSAGAQMFANRLLKNLARLKKWRAANSIECFRLYDADMPEYAVAIDRYGDWLHVAEYQAPRTVESRAAEQRLSELMTALPQTLEVPAERIVLKRRQRQRGRDQYRRRALEGQLIEVREGEARLLVNLHDYLDTGLFLDQRLLRLTLGAWAGGKTFLNLFCYTGAATVHAALGGAERTTSVDLSQSYLDWARRNLAQNGFSLDRHELVRADCVEWLAGETRRYDLILLAPPTFSNSKRMRGTFDIQRDQGATIAGAMRLLAPGGVLLFCTHRRKFTLAPSVSERFDVTDTAGRFTDADFARSRGASKVWEIRHRPDV